LKRSNRLVLLVGVFLAIVAFIAIILLQGTSRGPTQPQAPTKLPTVVAATDIPLGAKITADRVKLVELDIAGRSAGAYGDISQVLNKKVRQDVVADQQLTPDTFGETSQGQIIDIEVPAGRRAITVEVDQVTGVGTTIKTGDYVDMVVLFPPEQFPVITANPQDNTFTVVAGLNGTSVKLLLQGMQVLGTLLPPIAPQPAAQEGQPPPTQSGTTLQEGQHEIVALSVDAQMVEVIKFAQVAGDISLVLRSADDFIDPTTGLPLETPPLPDETTGIILKTLVDRYGVLPPELIETVLPEQPRR
jgi:Flp pilus assembly protein CpaB